MDIEQTDAIGTTYEVLAQIRFWRSNVICQGQQFRYSQIHVGACGRDFSILSKLKPQVLDYVQSARLDLIVEVKGQRSRSQGHT